MGSLVNIKWCLLVGVFYLIRNSMSVPIDADNSLVVSSTAAPSAKESGKEGESETNPQTTHIYQMKVTSKVSNRFAQNTVLSKVKNYAKTSQEASFSIVLPETGFISGFIMEIDGKNYTAYVKEKEEAKKAYEQAVASGQGAAHVAVSARDSNRFTVSVNIEPEAKASFYLKYEELLKRQDNHYELVINLHPGQPVKDLSVEVTISESRKIIDLKVPPLRSGNEISSEKAELDPRAEIRVVDEKNSVVTFSPNLERQKQLAGLLGTTKDNGLAGQFVVQYDVERDPHGGEVLISEGYFVHFFAPSDLQPLPKHVVFVLDTSGSMGGQKIVQLRESMVKILEQLNEQDKFNLVEFNTNVYVIDLDDANKTIAYPDPRSWHNPSAELYPPLKNIEFRPPYVATADNIKKAKAAVSNLTPSSSTNIYTALEVGLYQVELARDGNDTHQPIIIFLTDGEPNIRVESTTEITTKITEYNSGKRTSAIFTLSFGDYANKEFLQKIAARNNGFSRHIYEAADASLQLQNFYKQVSSPLLANVKFTYEPSTTSLTQTEFPIHFGGSELVVAGCYQTPEFLPPIIKGRGKEGVIIFKPTKVERPVSSVERLWAYLTVKQLLEKKEVSDKDVDDIKKKALEVALKYKFVTSVSSLVVVKPNSTNAVDTEAADKKPSRETALYGTGGLFQPISGQSYGSAGLPGPSGPFWVSHKHGVPHQSPNFFPDPPIFTTTVEPDLFSTLTWLNDVSKNGVLFLTKGNYKLGLNETITNDVDCPNAPKNTAGHCRLLHTCKHVYPFLVTKSDYEQHFCVLKNEFAGVCCPDIA